MKNVLLNRHIEGLFFPGDDGRCYVVGREGVTKITCEMVPGWGAATPWFHVWKGAAVGSTWNGGHVAGVTYFRDEVT